MKQTTLRPVSLHEAKSFNTLAIEMKVSVVICAFNAEQFIEEAVGSILGQTFEDFECIIVDDCSTDQTRAVICRLEKQEAKIRSVFLEKNRGPSYARNQGIALARGDWIAILDADDLFLPDRVEVLLRYAEQLCADVLVDNQLVVDFKSGRFLQTAFPFLETEEPSRIEMEFFLKSCVDVAFINAGYFKPFFKRSFWIENKLSYDPDYRISEDFILYVEMLRATSQFFGLPYVGYVYRIRGESVSQSNNEFLERIARISDHVRDLCAGKLTEQAEYLLELRKRRTLMYIPWISFKQSLKEKAIGRALKIAVLNPSIIKLTMDPVRARVLRWNARRAMTSSTATHKNIIALQRQRK